jgi:hypothetical protein
LRVRREELRPLPPETTDRVWDGLTRAWPSSPTCPSASWEGFCSACGFEPCFFFEEPDREDERSLLVFARCLEPEFGLDLDFDEPLRFEPLADCLLADFLLVGILSPPVISSSPTSSYPAI